jgi:geranylgeranyl pyrophosphate synthase
VVSVFETILTNQETNEVTQSTSIFTVNGIQFQVTDSYLDVIARLNEQ